MLLEQEPLHKFKIVVKSEDYEESTDEGIGAAVDLIFEYTPSYPDEPPLLEINPLHNLDDDDIEILRNRLQEQCSENLGMVMVFTLVSFTLEWLNNKIESDKKKQEEEKELKKKALEELERGVPAAPTSCKIAVQNFATGLHHINVGNVCFYDFQKIDPAQSN
ncbi:RWD domain-containing protein 1 [Armadillidium vulgare]|nr:RWD domain-containing protein 1 [Armadillidium vulgare]